MQLIQPAIINNNFHPKVVAQLQEQRKQNNARLQLYAAARQVLYEALSASRKEPRQWNHRLQSIATHDWCHARTRKLREYLPFASDRTALLIYSHTMKNDDGLF